MICKPDCDGPSGVPVDGPGVGLGDGLADGQGDGRGDSLIDTPPALTFSPDGSSDQLATPAAVLAVIGINWIYWKLDEAQEQIKPFQGNLISRAEKRVVIGLDSPKRMGHLAAEMGVLRSSLTATADQLVEKNMIERVPDPNDRRAFLLRLTDQGRISRQRIVEKAGELFAEATGLSCEEIETLGRITFKARQNILATGKPKGLKL
jgi:DNA-binding MarR family transcriptional regulator